MTLNRDPSIVLDGSAAGKTDCQLARSKYAHDGHAGPHPRRCGADNGPYTSITSHMRYFATRVQSVERESKKRYII